MAMYRVTLNMSLNYKKTPYNHNLSPGGFAPLKKLPAFAQVFSQQAVPAPYPVLAQGPVIFAGLLKQATQTAIADAACLHIHQHLWKILYTKVLNRQGPQHRSESTRLNSSHVRISYAVFCLKKKSKMELAFLPLRPIRITPRKFASLLFPLYVVSA